MEELIKKLKDAGKLETIESEEDLRAAAKELGYSDEDVDKLKSECESVLECELDDNVLDQVAGGRSDPIKKNTRWWLSPLSGGAWV